MEHQFGVLDLDLDTELGYVNFTVLPPLELSYTAIDDALESANYEMHTLNITAQGVLSSGDRFALDGTGQEFQLTGDGDQLAGSTFPQSGTLRGAFEAPQPDGTQVIRVLGFTPSQ